jgi:hypothetical protein
VDSYNYDHFDAYVESGADEHEFAAFPNMLHPGERAPDGELTILEGERVRLSELWRQRGLVLEFGSFTWPYCAAEGPLLDQLAAQHHEYGWYFVYTREAHPGENLPAHGSFEDKLAAARRLRDDLGITRPTLVDDLDGTLHRAYGLMPNMSWILGRGGTILYKAMWTSAARIGEFLERQREQPSGLAYAAFHTEQLELRPRDGEAFQGGLERNGPRAISEFARAEEIWAQRTRAAREAGRA